ncbi:MAG: glutathione S-transferase family protein [Alphaproteobacteria bacterium]|nr:glutathione S-transferase family protein [Alphaproteobacteria bacterium]
MTLTVHTISGAPRGWRVLLGLAFKGLRWDVNYLQASRQDHKSPEFLKLNPRGTVPVLEANGVVISDSIGCLAWLDRAYREQPLFGETPDEAARIWQLTMQACDYLRDANHELLSRVFSENPPSPGAADYDALKNGADAMHAECAWLENQLANGSFLAGARPGAADAVAYPEICLVERGVETKPEIMASLGFEEPSSRYPRLEAWKAAVSALPGVNNTLPPHWAA